MPQAAQPVNRFTTGQLPAELAELSEETLQLHGDTCFGSSVLSSQMPDGKPITCSNIPGFCPSFCSYDGDDAE
jgi:bacteriocin leader peptide (microcyclamide/patellamide family)